MKTVLVTGASGFIGKNLCARLQLETDLTVLQFTRQHTDDDLQRFVAQADFIYHLAAVMRPTDPAEFKTVNADLTARILELAAKKDRTTDVLVTSSVHAEGNSDYGKSKKIAEDAVYEWAQSTNNTAYVFRLPNVFGKWARPNYSSVVATFCHNIAHKLPIEIHDPSREIALSYIDDVTAVFVQALNGTLKKLPPGQPYTIERSFPTTLGDLASKIYGFENLRTQHSLPVFESQFDTFLFATYMSYVDNDQLGYPLDSSSQDARIFIDGQPSDRLLVDRTTDTLAMDPRYRSIFKKVFVQQGTAAVTLTNPYSNTTVTFDVSEDTPWVIDVPAGCDYHVQQKGLDELKILCWLGDLPPATNA